MGQGLVDEVGPLLKEGTQVELLRVVGPDAVVGDARAGVELLAGVDVHEGGALRHVEDVRHAQFLQAHGVLGHKPAGGVRGHTSAHWGVIAKESSVIYCSYHSSIPDASAWVALNDSPGGPELVKHLRLHGDGGEDAGESEAVKSDSGGGPDIYLDLFFSQWDLQSQSIHY